MRAYYYHRWIFLYYVSRLKIVPMSKQILPAHEDDSILLCLFCWHFVWRLLFLHIGTWVDITFVISQLWLIFSFACQCVNLDCLSLFVILYTWICNTSICYYYLNSSAYYSLCASPNCFSIFFIILFLFFLSMSPLVDVLLPLPTIFLYR